MFVCLVRTVDKDVHCLRYVGFDGHTQDESDGSSQNGARCEVAGLSV